MKKFLNILLVGLLAIATAVMCVACTPDNNGGTGGKSGLLLKKIDGVYTVYDYVAVEGETTLDIGEVLKSKNITEDINIKAGAFDGVTTLTKIIVPANVKEIAEGAFRKMSNLKTIELPFVGKTVNSDAFFKESATATDKSVDKARTIAHLFGTEEYDGGKNVTINAGNTTVSCYMPVTLEKVIINAQKVSEGKNSYSIPMHAFDGATNLKAVELKGAMLGAIGENAFSGCIALKSIEIPETVKTIYSNAFSGCSKLENVIFKGTVELRDSVFSGCKQIKYMGESVETAPTVETVSLKNVTALGENTLDFANEYVTYQVLDAGMLDLVKAFGETKYNY